MKRFDLRVLVFLFLVACTSNPKGSTTAVGVSEEVHIEGVIQLTGNFGDEISEEGAIKVTALLDQLQESDSVNLKLESEILATCAMKGCWMNVALKDDDYMRVTFKDYGFFVPKEGMGGKKVIIEGYAQKVTTNVETLQHFAKDAGKPQEEIDAIIEPKNEITFIASGVIIK